MPRNIAFFADGTWDEPANNSNVFRLYGMAKNDGVAQSASYDTGVGTDGTPLENLFGGAFGAGLFQKIKQGYADIASRYTPGDLLYIFGFSRGAYTARSLAGMIACSGLPTVNQNDPPCLDMAFEAYRNLSQRQMLLDALNESYKMDQAVIQFLGVWDTVGSLGIPAIFGGIDVGQYGFLDTGLHPSICNAVQAVSIDEKRLQFQPALWTSAPAPGQSLTQVWFTGVHCDVGGGYSPDSNGAALSNITLHWMAVHAQTCGFIFNEGIFPPVPLPADAVATLHDSLTGLYRICPHARNILPNSALFTSVPLRCAAPAAVYSPENLHLVSGQPAASYIIVAQ